MEQLKIFLSFVEGNASAISLIFLLGGGVFAWIKFREYIKDRRFKTYHDLIDQLVNDGSHAGGKLMLDRQIAIVFELRRFSKYHHVTKRMLEGLKNEEPWKTGNQRLITEIDLTLDYIESNVFCRLFKK